MDITAQNDSIFNVEGNFFNKEKVFKLLELVDVKNRRVSVKLINGTEITGKYVYHIFQTKIIPFHVNVPTTIYIETTIGVESFNTTDFASFEVDKNQY